jgi:hypothetical protein
MLRTVVDASVDWRTVLVGRGFGSKPLGRMAHPERSRPKLLAGFRTEQNDWDRSENPGDGLHVIVYVQAR